MSRGEAIGFFRRLQAAVCRPLRSGGKRALVGVAVGALIGFALVMRNRKEGRQGDAGRLDPLPSVP